MGRISRKGLALLAALVAFAWFGQPAWAIAPVTGAGTFEDRGADIALIKFADGNIFVHLILRSEFHGVVEGSRANDAITVLHPDGTFTAHGTGTCTCTVAGRSGTWTEIFDASGITNVSVTVRFTVAGGTEGLSNLRAIGIATGVPGGGGTCSINYHFD